MSDKAIRYTEVLTGLNYWLLKNGTIRGEEELVKLNAGNVTLQGSIQSQEKELSKCHKWAAFFAIASNAATIHDLRIGWIGLLEPLFFINQVPKDRLGRRAGLRNFLLFCEFVFRFAPKNNEAMIIGSIGLRFLETLTSHGWKGTSGWVKLGVLLQLTYLSVTSWKVAKTYRDEWADRGARRANETQELSILRDQARTRDNEARFERERDRRRAHRIRFQPNRLLTPTVEGVIDRYYGEYCRALTGSVFGAIPSGAPGREDFRRHGLHPRVSLSMLQDVLLARIGDAYERRRLGLPITGADYRLIDPPVLSGDPGTNAERYGGPVPTTAPVGPVPDPLPPPVPPAPLPLTPEAASELQRALGEYNSLLTALDFHLQLENERAAGYFPLNMNTLQVHTRIAVMAEGGADPGEPTTQDMSAFLNHNIGRMQREYAALSPAPGPRVSTATSAGAPSQDGSGSSRRATPTVAPAPLVAMSAPGVSLPLPAPVLPAPVPVVVPAQRAPQ
jgi:hypothetical protein